jgi:hypothetical protein
MPEPSVPARLFAAVALLVLLTGVFVAALVATSGVEDRIAEREVAAIRAAIATQAPAIAVLRQGQLNTGDPALRPIADGARQRTGGTVRLAGDDDSLLLQTDGTTHTDTSADVAAAFAAGASRTRVIGPAGSRQRITTVPFDTPAGALAVIALTPSRDARAADAAGDAIRRGAAIGLGAGFLVLLGALTYFRRKALIRSPKRS